MKPFYRMLTTCLTLTLSQIAFAQKGQKVVPVFFTPVEGDLANNCQKCDSLSDAYLQTGDTSMAIYYLDKFLEANPHEEQTKTAIKKFRKLYSHYSNSFYLREY